MRAISPTIGRTNFLLFDGSAASAPGEAADLPLRDIGVAAASGAFISIAGAVAMIFPVSWWSEWTLVKKSSGLSKRRNTSCCPRERYPRQLICGLRIVHQRPRSGQGE